MNPSSALGRVVILKNIAAKPELNSRYANVEEYKPATKRYLVRFIDHTTRASSLSAWVTEDKFDFVHPRVFPDHTDLRELVNDDKDKLLARYHTQDSLDDSVITSRIIDVDVTVMAYYFGNKGFVLGASGGGTDANGLYLPKTQIVAVIDIKLDNNTDVLEIEDIYFNMSEDTVTKSACVYIFCGTVIFRRCKFNCLGYYEVCIRGPNESLPNVVFENCVFRSGCNCFAGYASFLNCVFRNSPSTSIFIDNQSLVTVEYCDIRGGCKGINCEGNQCTISHSSIGDVGDGVLSPKGNVFINDCLIYNTPYRGVLSSNSSCTIERCKFVKCQIGVLASCTGKVQVLDSEFVDCKRGVQVEFDCVGTVTVKGCTFPGSGKDVSHAGQSKCVVVVNGERIKKNGELSVENLHSSSAVSSYITEDSDKEYLIRRSLKNAGKLEYSPLCGHCGAQEPEDQKYCKCSRCCKIAYCSRECQKAAWKTHKTTCVDASLIASGHV